VPTKVKWESKLEVNETYCFSLAASVQQKIAERGGYFLLGKGYGGNIVSFCLWSSRCGEDAHSQPSRDELRSTSFRDLRLSVDRDYSGASEKCNRRYFGRMKSRFKIAIVSSMFWLRNIYLDRLEKWSCLVADSAKFSSETKSLGLKQERTFRNR